MIFLDPDSCSGVYERVLVGVSSPRDFVELLSPPPFAADELLWYAEEDDEEDEAPGIGSPIINDEDYLTEDEIPQFTYHSQASQLSPSELSHLEFKGRKGLNRENGVNYFQYLAGDTILKTCQSISQLWQNHPFVKTPTHKTCHNHSKSTKEGLTLPNSLHFSASPWFAILPSLKNKQNSDHLTSNWFKYETTTSIFEFFSIHW